MLEVTLDGLPPVKRKRVVKRKKFTPVRGVPVEVSVRRQLAAEIGEDEPTKDQKYGLLQKYGITPARVDRLVTKPMWMGVAEWKRKQNYWFQATKGMVSPSQRPRFNRPRPVQPTSQPRTNRPWSQIKHKTRASRPNSSPTRTATLPK